MYSRIKKRSAYFAQQAIVRIKKIIEVIFLNFVLGLTMVFGLIFVTLVLTYEIAVYGKPKEEYDRDVRYKLANWRDDGSHY